MAGCPRARRPGTVTAPGLATGAGGSTGASGVAPQGGDPRARPGTVRIDLSTCVCRYGPPPSALAVAQAVSADVLRAHPYGAVDELAEAYGAYLGVAPGELVAGRGVSELVWLLASGPLGPRVAVPLPAYTEFRQAFPGAALGPPGPHHPLEVVADGLARGAAVLLANPHNPSGRAFTAAELAGVAAAHPEGVLVVDESYVEFCADPAAVTLVSAAGARSGNVVVLRSPSKFFGLAGCRVGVAWSPSAELRRAFDRPRGSWPLSALEVAPVVAALADRGWASTTRIQLVEDGAWLDGRLDRLGEVVGGAVTPFRLVLADGATALAAELGRAGLGVRLLGGGHGLAGPALRVAAPMAGERAAVAAMLGAVRPG